jgi:hypothetical protein
VTRGPETLKPPDFVPYQSSQAYLTIREAGSGQTSSTLNHFRLGGLIPVEPIPIRTPRKPKSGTFRACEASISVAGVREQGRIASPARGKEDAMRSTTHASRLRRALVGFAAPLIVAVSALGPSGATVVAAGEPSNIVLVWNENAINVINAGTAATPPGLGHAPPLAPLDLAMVHGAIYDAVNAIDRGHQPYLKGLSAPSTASKAAAVAQAAHDVLAWLTPDSLPLVKTRIDGMLDDSLDLIDPGQAKDDGIKIGTEAATAMRLARANDGRFDSEPFPTSDEVGHWRLVPPLSANAFGQFATVTPLTMKSPAQFRTEGPIADLTSAAYAAEFNEVKALGAQTGSSRTPEQTLLAGFVFANPLLYMNKGLRDIATAKGLSTAQQAMLFVRTSFASADALIACWNDKANWLVWRPQTAIHEAASDGNDATAPDANWKSLFPTPATRTIRPATTATPRACGTAPVCSSGRTG